MRALRKKEKKKSCAAPVNKISRCLAGDYDYYCISAFADQHFLYDRLQMHCKSTIRAARKRVLSAYSLAVRNYRDKWIILGVKSSAPCR